jgi:hypothetical protein
MSKAEKKELTLVSVAETTLTRAKGRLSSLVSTLASYEADLIKSPDSAILPDLIAKCKTSIKKAKASIEKLETSSLESWARETEISKLTTAKKAVESHKTFVGLMTKAGLKLASKALSALSSRELSAIEISIRKDANFNGFDPATYEKGGTCNLGKVAFTKSPKGYLVAELIKA